jgi:pyrroloquinoline-quinone synthase
VTDLVERLRAEGRRRYHDQHPFHRRMHAGELSPDELRRWVVNRWYYQTRIPIKDALILAKCEDRAVRRRWVHRLHDHDDEGGGLELWERLCAAVGAHPERAAVLPGVRFACDAYVDLVRRVSLVEAVASSLTEWFAPDLMRERIAAWERHYPWVPAEALAYFRARVPRAARDGEEALAFVVEHATTPALEDGCVAALVTKTEILWHLLDCVSAA